MIGERKVLTETGVVYKYFDLIDGFIRVRVLAGEEPLRLPPSAGKHPPDRREYRRMVVAACVVGLEETVLPKVQQIYPEDVAAAEDLLYQICVDVNPRLEIHTVSLPADEEGEQEEGGVSRLQEKSRGLEARLLQEIVGQDESVGKICRAVRKAACGLKDPQRPIGSFLLVGRTGVGKTELAKALARNLYGPENLIRVDCSEFALPHETAKLIGAPPGYVGHNEGGVLTEALMRDPNAVVLFDEIEKGHEKLHNMLLQILDEGRLTDSKGNTVSFQNAVILLTSNVGTEDYAQATQRVGFERPGSLAEADFDDLTKRALRRNFKPELMNRLSSVLVFGSLDEKACTRIAEMHLQNLALRLQSRGIDLHWTPALPRELARLGHSEEYGAREVRRVIDRRVEEPLSNHILDRDLGPGCQVRLRWRTGEVLMEWKGQDHRRCA
ncbi:MAG: ATP-dependent Clp protease ATP-binding subunit [Planctomycetota bacterium]|nr:MAG: ATP-dependent Clp protease ATP-binding subunit [Planctomycetota bacterium]